jgi:hypothetical protein
MIRRLAFAVGIVILLIVFVLACSWVLEFTRQTMDPGFPPQG